MSKLLEDIQKIQSETGCSLAEAKEAYDKASCDIDLAIALVKEGKANKPQPIQEEKKEVPSKSYSFLNAFVRDKQEPKPEKQEKPVKNSKLYEAITKNETKEEIEARVKKMSKFIKIVIVFGIILAVVFLGLYFGVSKKDTYLGFGIAGLVMALLYGLLGSMMNKQNKALLNLVEKYPNVETGQIKTIVMKYKGKDFDAMERELKVLSGEAGEAQKQELANQNLNVAQDFSKKAKRNNRLGPILFVLIIVVGLLIALPIIGKAYGTDFGMGDVFSSCSIGNQGGSPRKAYKLIKEDIQNQGKTLGIDDIKFNSAQYVVINDTKPAKAGAADTDEFMSGEDYTVILKVSYSYNYGGTQNKTEYWGYNPKTNSIKEFPSYYGSSDFSLAQSQVQGGYYKGRTGSL
ncbi:MAG: hypothetical protein K6E74_02675 [Bacilli bacterium]|nr:hypothetical protein [Bacilli bacterium]